MVALIAIVLTACGGSFGTDPTTGSEHESKSRTSRSARESSTSSGHGSASAATASGGHGSASASTGTSVNGAAEGEPGPLHCNYAAFEV